NKACEAHRHAGEPRAFGKRIGRLYHYIGGAMSAQHRDAQKATQESKGIEKSEEAAGVAGAKIGIEPERQALQQIAECDAEDESGDETAKDQSHIPDRPPSRAVDLAAELEGDRSQNESYKHDEHRDIKAGKGGG